MVPVKDKTTGEVIYLRGKWHDAYLDRLAPLTRSCEHDETELRQRGRSVVYQCIICGSQKGGAVPRMPAHDVLPEFDASLPVLYQKTRTDQKEALISELIAAQREENDKAEGSQEAAALDYASYLRTQEWQQRRLKVLRRAGGTCEGCLSAKATQVHHKSYLHVRDELLYDLVALCRSCHEKAHPEHHEQSDLYEDYSPCSSCRWDGGGLWCGKFELATHEAFEAGGPCFPPGQAREPMK